MSLSRLSPVPTGTRIHALTLEHPSLLPDGEGGYTTTWTTIVADMRGRIDAATAGNLERLAASTVVAGVTHIVTIPYHADVSIDTRIVFGPRRFSVVGIENPEYRNRELILTCAELLS